MYEWNFGCVHCESMSKSVNHSQGTLGLGITQTLVCNDMVTCTNLQVKTVVIFKPE